MDGRRKVFLLDGLQGLVWLVLGILFGGPAVLDTLWWLVGPTAVATAGAFAVEEHGYAPANTWTWFGIVVVGILTVTAAAIAAGPAVMTTVSALLVGMGIGVLGYRLVYGVVRPIPERRLDRARRRGV